MKLVFVLMTILLVGGCATSNQFVVAEYEVNDREKLPPITVFTKHPSEEFKARCQEFDDKSLLHHCEINTLNLEDIYAELQESRVFSNTSFADNNELYQLMITTAMYNFEDGAELGNAALAGATLMLAPMKISTDVHVEAVLTWNGRLVSQSDFELPFEMRASLLTMSKNNPQRDLAKSIVSHLISDLQGVQAFSAHVLRDALNSANYDADLIAPDVLGDYQHEKTISFRHPFEGAQIRFAHNKYASDYIDTFVYPIKDWRWDDPEKILERESVSVRKDMDLAEKKELYKNVKLSDDSWFSVDGQSAPIQILRFDGEYLSNVNEQEYLTEFYLFAIQDKILKVRVSFAKGSADLPDMRQIVEQLAREIKVPDESIFMAEVRKNWRDNGRL